MACQRSREIDLPAFLAAPRGEEFGDFRLHYPRCAECAAEVRAWTELHEALVASHPEPEQLARYAALAPQERAVVDRHVSACPSCREELAQLADFDPARLALPAGPTRPTREGGLRAWLAGLGRIFWHPAFAYALLLLMMVPFAQQLARDRAERPLAEQLFAEAPEGLDRVAGLEDVAPAEPPAGGLAKRGPEEGVLAQKRAAAAPAPARDTAAERAAPAPPAPELPRDEPARLVQAKGDDEDAALERRLPVTVRQRALATVSPTQEGEAGAARSLLDAAPAQPASDEVIAARADTPGEAKEETARVGAEFAAPQAAGPAHEPRGLAAALQSEPQALAGGTSRAAPAPMAAAAPPRDLVRLEAWRTARVRPPQDVAVLRFAVPVPAALHAGTAQVRVSDAEQRRELGERVEVPAAGAAERRVTLHVPRSWLEPGVYRVELEGAGAPPVRFAFEVY